MLKQLRKQKRLGFDAPSDGAGKGAIERRRKQKTTVHSREKPQGH
jgi:hypothetical protein